MPGRWETWPIRRRDLALVALTVLPLLALAVVAVVSVGHGYHGADDNAMTELRISDIGHFWPELGPFSRDGWSHPGPALFYALVLPYRLTGGHSNGLMVGAALINAAAIGGMVLLARRRGGTALALIVALGALVMTQSLGPSFLWNPWNPLITVFPFGLAVLATWCIVCGDVWCLPLLAVLGTFCAQTHIEYAPLVAVLVAVAVVGLVLHARSARRDSEEPGAGLMLPVAVSVGVLLVAWAPPLYQEATARTGNLSTIWDYFRTGSPTHSLRQCLDVVTAQFAWKPNWLVGNVVVNPFSGQPTAVATTSWPVWWLPLAIALAWTWRTGRRAARALGVVLVVMIVAGIVAIVRTLGPLYEYRLRFVWLLGMLTAAYAIWVLVLALAAHFRPSDRSVRIVTGVALAAIAVLSVAGVADAGSAPAPNAHNGRIVAALSPQVLRHVPRAPGVVLLSVRGDIAGPVLTGLMVDLEHHGIPVRLRDMLDDRRRFGSQRILSGERVRAAMKLTADGEIEQVTKERCARMVAYRGRRSPPVQRRAVEEIQRLQRAAGAGRISGVDAIRRAARESKKVPAVAVFRVDCRPAR